ncbi:uncharacterized protein LOC114516411 isoform X2 [Dendronephthya gigantea]|nr:uncharacterized protein LOC114516411 isoform X2 [Dendronephthya gigantea]
MLHNYGRAIDLFRRFDLNGDGCLTYEEFYAGMRDLDAPCNKIELYLLAKKLDQDSNELIDYLEFSKGLKYFRKSDIVPDTDLPNLTIVREKLKNCPCCKLGLWKPMKEAFPRYIQLELRLVTFANVNSYPGNFEILIHAHVSIYSIVELIHERLGESTQNLTIYKDNEREMVVLDPNVTLQETGFEGGPKNLPQDVALLYDYMTEFNDCPILTSDHYF